VNLGPGVSYAGFWRRLAATGLDLLLFIALAAPLMLAIYSHPYLFWSMEHGALLRVYGVWDLLLVRLLPVSLFILLWSRWGATPGKLLMNCRIVDVRTGQPPAAWRAGLRLAAYVISALPFYLGFFWIGWDRRKQGFHDKIAGTVVYHQEADYAASDLEGGLEGWPEGRS